MLPTLPVRPLPQPKTCDGHDQPRSATLGTLRILEGAGHYPYAECRRTRPVVTTFRAEHVHA